MATIGIYPYHHGLAIAIIDGDIREARVSHLEPSRLGLIAMELGGLDPSAKYQMAAADTTSPFACIYYGVCAGVLSARGVNATIIPTVDYMGAIALGPKGRKEKALIQAYKLWRLTLNTQAEALALAVAAAEGDKH